MHANKHAPSLFAAMALAGTLCLSLGLMACEENPCSKRHCEVKTSVAHIIDFAVEEQEGVVRGFDLDDRISADRDAKTCGHADLVDPSGAPGIDNNAAVLFDAISGLTEASLEGLIRGSINEGRLLLVFQLFGLDDVDNDECVDVEMFQAKGTPVVGTDGFILSDQTFDIDEEQPRTSIKCAKVIDGVLHAGPFDGNLFVSILGVHVNLSLYRAKLSATLGKNGVSSMVLGAGIDKDELHQVIEQTNDRTITDIGHFLVDSLADMGNVNGKCQQLSSTVVIETKGAYLF